MVYATTAGSLGMDCHSADSFPFCAAVPSLALSRPETACRKALKGGRVGCLHALSGALLADLTGLAGAGRTSDLAGLGHHGWNRRALVGVLCTSVERQTRLASSRPF